DDRLQFCLLSAGNPELVQGLLEVIHESFPLFGRDVQVAVRIGHRTSGVFLWTSGRPANHFGNKILEAGRRHSVMGFVHGGVRIQTAVCHDAVDEIIDHDSDALNSAEALIEGRLLWLCRHGAIPLCVWPCYFPKMVGWFPSLLRPCPRAAPPKRSTRRQPWQPAARIMVAEHGQRQLPRAVSQWS